jgi:uncharacterized membrane protein
MENLKFRQVLVRTDEGRVFLCFAVLAILMVGIFLFFLKTDPVFARTLVLALVANATGGRAAGVVICLSSFGILGTILYNTLMEVLNVCLMYSLFVLSFNRYLEIKWFKRMSANLEVAAHKYERKISIYGWIGLFFFVMIPLPVTGPVVGSIVGYFLRLRIWKNFSAVLSGSIVSIVIWTEFFDVIEKYLHIMQYLLAAIILVVVISCFKLIRSFYKEFIAEKKEGKGSQL